MLIQPSLDSCLARVIDFFDGYNFVKLTSNYQKKKLLFQCQKNGTKVTDMKTWHRSNI